MSIPFKVRFLFTVVQVVVKANISISDNGILNCSLSSCSNSKSTQGSITIVGIGLDVQLLVPPFRNAFVERLLPKLLEVEHPILLPEELPITISDCYNFLDWIEQEQDKFPQAICRFNYLPG